MKNAIIFTTIGCCFGALGTYFFMKDKFEAKLDVEIEDLRNYYRERCDLCKKEEPTTSEEKEETDIPKKEKPVKRKKPEVEVEPDYDEIIEKLNYNQYSTVVGKAKKPYIISLSEYNEDRSYDKKIMSYFTEDDVLMDSETEEVISDINKVIGYENIEEFGINTDDCEIYIRNEELGIDYQIIAEHGSYEDFLDDLE